LLFFAALGDFIVDYSLPNLATLREIFRKRLVASARGACFDLWKR